tara:strand:+ start:142 stop:390 length:249 start_codon:yes stop_codon:yes gene_type:complete
MNSIKISTYLITFSFLFLNNAYAYLDPGTGGFIIQMIVAFIATALIFFKNGMLYIKNFFFKFANFFKKKNYDDEKKDNDKKV